MNEAIILPIDIDPGRGIAALKQFGEEANNATDSLKNTGGAAASLGTKIAGVTTIVVVGIEILRKLGEELFGNKELFSQSELAIASFGAALDNVKNQINDLKESLDFKSDIEKLKLELSGITGFNLQKEKSFVDIKENNAFLTQTQKTFDALKKNDQIFKNLAQQFIATDEVLKSSGITKGTGLGTLLKQFSDVTDIPQSLISKLSKKDQEGLQLYIKNTKDLEELTDKRKSAIQNIEKSVLSIGIDSNAEQKRLQELAIRDYDKYVNEIISKGKSVASDLKNIFVVPSFTVFDSKAEAFKKAKTFLDDFSTGNLKIKAQVGLDIIVKPLEPEEKAATDAEINEILKSLNPEVSEPFKIDLSINQSMKTWDETKKRQAEILAANERIAAQLSGSLAPAFNAVFDAVKAGESPLRAFFSGIGNAVQQLIQQLIQAAIQAAVLSLLTGGVGKPGGLSFAGAFKKIFGFAGGGLIGSPVLSLIGEGRGTSRSNPEVVSPLNQLKGFFAGMLNDISGRNNISGAGVSQMQLALNIPSEVMLYADGDGLRGILSLTDLKQSRTR